MTKTELNFRYLIANTYITAYVLPIFVFRMHLRGNFNRKRFIHFYQHNLLIELLQQTFVALAVLLTTTTTNLTYQWNIINYGKI